ncbi:uncharacterized protein LOC129575635 [Sitodiplosis mosellana]|uniref:uncharacterized protein LOC129575635 n=1 Tax=Sitodiplosis mosellana TaxID=263140 RepID=UPI002444F718|nr:uncharacterized protein LOC129575635 [Sitodiplosis mosellana]
MKLFPLVFVVGFVQLCWCSSIAKRSSEIIEQNGSNIERFRSDWKTIPGIKPGAVDDFISIFDKFRPNSTDQEIIEGTVQLVSLALNVDVSKINKTIFEHFSQKNTNENDNNSEEVEGTSPKGITENDLKELETILSKELAPAQTKLAIQIFHGFRQGATAREKEAALVNLYTSAISGAFGKPKYDVVDNENVSVEWNENNEV